jgi:hypothetical protein
MFALAGALSIHCLKVFNPTVQSTVALHQLVSNTSDFLDDGIASHDFRLRRF